MSCDGYGGWSHGRMTLRSRSEALHFLQSQEGIYIRREKLLTIVILACTRRISLPNYNSGSVCTIALAPLIQLACKDKWRQRLSVPRSPRTVKRKIRIRCPVCKAIVWTLPCLRNPTRVYCLVSWLFCAHTIRGKLTFETSSSRLATGDNRSQSYIPGQFELIVVP